MFGMVSQGGRGNGVVWCVEVWFGKAVVVGCGVVRCGKAVVAW